MSILFSGAKHQFRKGVTYGQVGVDLAEEAGKLAREMESRKEAARIAQREEESRPRESDPDVYMLATRYKDGSYALESVESYGKIGEIKARGKTLEIALANAQFEFVKRLLLLKSARDLGEASARVAKINFHVSDISEKKTMVGAGD